MARYWVGGTANWNTTVGTKWATVSGGAGGATVPTASDDVFFDGIATGGGAAGAIVVTINASVACLNLNCTGFAGTIAGTSALAISASLTCASSWTYTGIITLNATTAQTITSNAVALKCSLIFNGVAGSWTLQDAYSSTKDITLTNGTFSTGGKTVTSLTFTSSNANTRVVDISGTTWTLTGAGNAWNMNISTLATLTIDTSSKLLLTNASASAKTVFTGALTYNDLEFTGAGTGSFALSGASTFRDVAVSCSSNPTTSLATTTCRDLTYSGGYSGNISGGTATVTRDLTFTLNMTSVAGVIIIFASTGAGTVTSNGCTGLANAFRQNGAGGTTTLIDALYTSGQFGLFAGTFDTGNQAVTVSRMNLSAALTTRQVNCGSSLITLTATGTVLTVSGDTTGLTWNPDTCTIFVQSSGAVEFATGLIDYYNVTLAGGGGGVFSFNGSPAFTNRLQINSGPYTISFQNGATATLAPGGLVATGSAGNLITLQSAVAGSQATVSCPKNDIVCDYVSVKDLVGTGGARFFAGKNSVDAGNNNGWRYTNVYRSPFYCKEQ